MQKLSRLLENREAYKVIWVFVLKKGRKVYSSGMFHKMYVESVVDKVVFFFDVVLCHITPDFDPKLRSNKNRSYF
jgi:hypothetical protein